MGALDQKEAWLLQRREGIGGTDAAAVCGLSPWKRPIDVFVEKTENMQQEPPSQAMFWGTYLEAGVRKRYAEATGQRVKHGRFLAPLFGDRAQVFGKDTIVQGDEAWKFGTPDGVLASKTSGLEIKTSGRRSHEWGTVGSDEVPAHYLVQCAWLMHITGIRVWDLAALFSGNTMEVFRIVANDDLTSSIVGACRAFWHDNVLRGVPPDIDESESYGKYLSRKFALSDGAMVGPTPALEKLAAQLRDASKALEAAEDAKRLVRNKLLLELGPHAGCRTEAGTVKTVRSAPVSSVDWKKVAADLGPGPELIAKHTKTSPRDAYVRGWFKGDED